MKFSGWIATTSSNLRPDGKRISVHADSSIPDFEADNLDAAVALVLKQHEETGPMIDCYFGGCGEIYEADGIAKFLAAHKRGEFPELPETRRFSFHHGKVPLLPGETEPPRWGPP